MEKEKLQDVIAGAKKILVPSLWYDPSPFAVLEAMGAGKVVVASKIGGIPELIKDGKTGFLIPSPGLRPPSPLGRGEGEGQWVDTINKIYYDEELLKRIGAAARLSIKEAHGPETHYEKIMEIYRATGN
mgnify:FL=1